MPGTDNFGETTLKQDITYLQHQAEITQSHTFAALVQAYVAT